MVPLTIPGVVLHYRNGDINIGDVINVLAGSFAGIFAGSWLGTHFIKNERTIGRVMTVVLALSTVYLFHKYFL